MISTKKIYKDAGLRELKNKTLTTRMRPSDLAYYNALAKRLGITRNDLIMSALGFLNYYLIKGKIISVQNHTGTLTMENARASRFTQEQPYCSGKIKMPKHLRGVRP